MVHLEGTRFVKTDNNHYIISERQLKVVMLIKRDEERS